MLEKVELSDALSKKPAELSGGMCRRVALARALAFDADILLLDEPFKGLDTELRGRIVKLVEDFAKTKPVILITHDPWEVSLAKAKLDIESKNPAVSNSRYFLFIYAERFLDLLKYKSFRFVAAASDAAARGSDVSAAAERLAYCRSVYRRVSADGNLECAVLALF